MIRLMFFACLSLVSHNCLAQNQLKLFASAGAKQDIVQVKDDTGNLLYEPMSTLWNGLNTSATFSGGIELYRSYNSYFSVTYTYHEAYDFTGFIFPENSPESAGEKFERGRLQAVVSELKFDIGRLLYSKNKRFIFIPKIGLGYAHYFNITLDGFMSRSRLRWGYFDEDGANKNLYAHTHFTEDLRWGNFLIHGGLQFEMRVNKVFSIYISSDYVQGLLKAYETDITYQLLDQEQHTAYSFSRNSTASFSFGLKFTLYTEGLQLMVSLC